MRLLDNHAGRRGFLNAAMAQYEYIAVQSMSMASRGTSKRRVKSGQKLRATCSLTLP